MCQHYSPNHRASRWHELLALMEEEKIYLDPQLLQQHVAERLRVSCRTLTRLLAEHSPYNFNGFVNAYRIREAARLLRDCRKRNLSVAAIGAKAGFNSRGVFYRAFTQQLGESPAAYRAKHLVQSS